VQHGEAQALLGGLGHVARIGVTGRKANCSKQPWPHATGGHDGFRVEKSLALAVVRP
jgi:hypothetical protein